MASSCHPAICPGTDASSPNLIRFRTFSEAYGMAGARVGYGIGHPDLIGAFNKVRNHFGMSRVSQAGALAALADAYLAEVIESVASARVRIAEIATTNGLTALPSAVNFVAVDCGGDGAFAKSVLSGHRRLRRRDRVQTGHRARALRVFGEQTVL